jgi:hypothetical protein
VRTIQMRKITLGAIVLLFCILFFTPSAELGANPPQNTQYKVLNLSKNALQSTLEGDAKLKDAFTSWAKNNMQPQGVTSEDGSLSMITEFILNYYAKQGWQLVCATDAGKLFLKR